MPTTRLHSIVRLAVVALVGGVLLLSGYVGSYLGMYWLDARHALGPTIATLENTIYAPVVTYITSDGPGGMRLDALRSWCVFQGSGNPIPWSEYEEVLERHQSKAESDRPTLNPDG